MRIAWMGPMPNGADGASGVSNQLLRELDKREVEIDCFVPGHEEAIPANLRNVQHIRFICGPSCWQWGKWYSRNRLMSFITGQMANLSSENRLAHKLLEMHRSEPYDVIYQFSHIEFSSLRRYRVHLPPIVLHLPPIVLHPSIRTCVRRTTVASGGSPPFESVGVRRHAPWGEMHA